MKNQPSLMAYMIVLFAFAFDFSFLLLKFPAENRDMINMILGVVNTGALITVINYYFGSSSSSKGKDEMIGKMMDSEKGSG